MRTQILSLPFVQMAIRTTRNEDWVDTIRYVVEENGPQLDLRGIDFDMQIRRRPDLHEVMLTGSSTRDRFLSIADPPNVGILVIHVPVAIMKNIFVGQYVGEIRARDDRFYRICITFDLTISEGVTR